MKNTTRTVRAGLAVLLLSTAAIALSGKDGYVAAPVFSLSDIQSSIVYDGGFASIEWNDMDTFALGPLARTVGVGEEAGLAVNSDGVIFALVYGFAGTDYYTGVVSFDVTGCTNVAQDALLDAGVPWLFRAGGNMKAVAVSSVTDGLITNGHLLVVRTWREEARFDPDGDNGATYLQLLDVDPDTGQRTLVHEWLCSIGANARVAMDPDGAIYVLQTGVLDAAGDPTGPSIRKLAWSGTDYDESTLVTGVEGGVLVGPDGYVYAFADHHGLGWSYSDGTKPEILRVDPDTGATSSHAQVDGKSFIHDWAFDSEGVLRIALDGGRKKQAISTVSAGGTATAGTGAIANWTGDFLNLVPGTQGRLYVAEAVFDSDADVQTLDPGSDGGGNGGGGGGKGGGNGGGKGKNK